MSVITPHPQVDIAARVPALAETSRVTIRLHPRRMSVPDPAASKIGGVFLWPKSEPWPECETTDPPYWWEGEWPVPEGARVSLIPVLQLKASDVPEMEFFPGTDHFQLL